MYSNSDNPGVWPEYWGKLSKTEKASEIEIFKREKIGLFSEDPTIFDPGAKHHADGDKVVPGLNDENATSHGRAVGPSVDGSRCMELPILSTVNENAKNSGIDKQTTAAAAAANVTTTAAACCAAIAAADCCAAAAAADCCTTAPNCTTDPTTAIYHGSAGAAAAFSCCGAAAPNCTTASAATDFCCP